MKLIYLLLLIAITLSACIQLKQVESELIEDSRGYKRHTVPQYKYVDHNNYKYKKE